METQQQIKLNAMTAQRAPANYIDKRPLFARFKPLSGILLSVVGFFAAQQVMAFNYLIEKFDRPVQTRNRISNCWVETRR